MRWLQGSFWMDWWRGHVPLSDEQLHLSDEQLLLFSDGELRGLNARRTRLHLEACWICRARQEQFQETITQFTEAYQEFPDQAASLRPALPASLRGDKPPNALDGSTPPKRSRPVASRFRWLAAAALAGILGILVFVKHEQKPVRSGPLQAASPITPDARLTPGAAVRYKREQVCGEVSENNRQVPAPLRRKVLASYGLGEEEPYAYEVDYLITPALGGADDIRNMWPQTYSAEWNARVKDELEDRLRQMVCSGDLDLATAQTEIASNWIAAYKKYFHTDRPMEVR